MRQSFLPSTDAGLLAWSANFSTLISAEPVAYGLTAPQATAYASAQSAYSSAYTIANTPANRTHPAIVAKNTARAALIDITRLYAKLVEGTATVSDAAKAELGLNVRKQPAPIPPPEMAPMLDIVSVNGRTVTVKLHTDDSNRRGKPEGVASATVFSYVGATPPDDTGAWKMEGTTTRLSSIDVTFAPTLEPGATVWLTAFFSNPRSQSGPACVPMSVTFGAANVSYNGSLKLAA